MATDLDGTFLNSSAQVSPRTAAALNRLREDGIPVVGVTGRAPRLLYTVHEYFGGEGIVVLAQGAFVGDLATGEVLRQVTMPSSLALDITAQIEQLSGPLLYAGEYPTDGHHVLYVEPGFAWPYNEGREVVVRADLPTDGPALKFYLKSDQHSQDALLEIARSVVPSSVAELTHAGLGFIELCPPGVTKASGLAVALERYGVGRCDVLVFGDMPNDLPMFGGWAGRAVAVANAHPDVLAVADEITGTNDEDGVAAYLGRLLWPEVSPGVDAYARNRGATTIDVTPHAAPGLARLIDAVRTGLAAIGDPERASGQQRYMKSAMPYRGVRSPALDRLCRGLFAEHILPDRTTWETAVRTVWDEARYREERYAAIALSGYRAYASYQDPAALPLYEHMIVSGAWWDYVDEIAIRRVGPILRGDPEEVAPMLRGWSTDEDMWRRRTAIIAQIKSKADTDLDLLNDVLASNLGHKEFFVRKAIGWALREYAKTDPGWVRCYLADHGQQMSALSRREAAKHL